MVNHFKPPGSGRAIVKYFQPYKIGLALIFCLAVTKPGYATHTYWQMWAIDASGVDMDGDLDVLTTEEGAGIFTAGDGVLWLENPLHPAASLPGDHLAE